MFLIVEGAKNTVPSFSSMDVGHEFPWTGKEALEMANKTLSDLLLKHAQHRYYYFAGHKPGRVLAEKVSLAPARVRARFVVQAIHDREGTEWDSSAVMESGILYNAPADKAIADALADDMAAYAHSVYSYKFTYTKSADLRPASTAQMVHILLECVREALPPVAVKFAVQECVPCIRGMTAYYKFEDVATGKSWVGEDAVYAFQDKLTEVTNMLVPIFNQDAAARNVYHFTYSSKDANAARTASFCTYPNIQFKVVSAHECITTLYCPDGSVHYGPAAVETLMGLHNSSSNQQPDTLVDPPTAAPDLNLPLSYFYAARSALFTPPAGYAANAVRFRMYVRASDQTTFIQQLNKLPADWRARIAVVFVSDTEAIKKDVVDRWPPSGFLPANYTQSVLMSMLLWA
jgi:hypothetical protein